MKLSTKFRGYIRVTKYGPTYAEQEAALRAYGFTDFSEIGPVYVDDQTKRRRGAKPGDSETPELDTAIDRIRPGETLVIATPGRLAATARDALRRLKDLAERQAVLHVVSTDRTYRWHKQAADALELAEAALSERQHEVARKARAAIKPSNRRPPVAALTPAEKKKIAPFWSNAKLSAEEAAERATEALKRPLSKRTLYRYFGPKGTPNFGRKPGAKKR